jgi:hypothetical protein
MARNKNGVLQYRLLFQKKESGSIYSTGIKILVPSVVF